MSQSQTSSSDDSKWRALFELVKPLAPKAAVYTLSLGAAAISGYATLSPEIKPLVDAVVHHTAVGCSTASRLTLHPSP